MHEVRLEWIDLMTAGSKFREKMLDAVCLLSKSVYLAHRIFFKRKAIYLFMKASCATARVRSQYRSGYKATGATVKTHIDDGSTTPHSSPGVNN